MCTCRCFHRGPGPLLSVRVSSAREEKARPPEAEAAAPPLSEHSPRQGTSAALLSEALAATRDVGGNEKPAGRMSQLGEGGRDNGPCFRERGQGQHEGP